MENLVKFNPQALVVNVGDLNGLLAKPALPQTQLSTTSRGELGVYVRIPFDVFLCDPTSLCIPVLTLSTEATTSANDNRMSLLFVISLSVCLSTMQCPLDRFPSSS